MRLDFTPPPPPFPPLPQISLRSRGRSRRGFSDLRLLSPFTRTLYSLHSKKELHTECPRVLAVLKFRKEVLNAMKNEKNQDVMAIFH